MFDVFGVWSICSITVGGMQPRWWRTPSPSASLILNFVICSRNSVIYQELRVKTTTWTCRNRREAEALCGYHVNSHKMCAMRSCDYFCCVSPCVGSEFEAMVANLMNLGFEHDQVVRALRASFNNPDRAAEYLFSVRS